MSDRLLTVQQFCRHGQAAPHLSSAAEGRCEVGRSITLDDHQAIKLAQGYVIDVSEVIEAVLADTARPSA